MFLEIKDYELTFGMKEFCLETKFHFGMYFPALDSIYDLQLCVFHMVVLRDSESLEDIKRLFENYLDNLSDKDAVRI